jgi:hypothetical protein
MSDAARNNPSRAKKEKFSVPDNSGDDDTSKSSNCLSNHIPMEDEDEESKPFLPSHGLTTAAANTLLEKWGRNELEEHHKPKVQSFTLLIFH